jgi:hypothetical protein
MIFLFALQSLVVYNRRLQENGNVHGRGRMAFWELLWEWFIHFGWLEPLWRWVKFWLSLVLGVALQILLFFGYISLNPFVSWSGGWTGASYNANAFRSSTLNHMSFLLQVSPSLTSLLC